MINLTDEQKAQFYKDSTRKELILTTNKDWTSKSDSYQQSSSVNNVENLNLYYGDTFIRNIIRSVSMDLSKLDKDPYTTKLFVNRIPYETFDADAYIYNDLFICDKKYVKIYVRLNVLSVDGEVEILGEECTFNIHYINKLGNIRIYSTPFTIEGASSSDMRTISICIPNDIMAITTLSVSRGSVYNPQEQRPWWVYGSRLIITLSNDNTPLTDAQASNYNFQVTGINIEDYMTFKILNNEDLVSESFSLNESLCSQENLKFGLCESANCKVTTVNNNYQYKNVPFHVFTKVYTPDSNQLTSSDLDVINFANNNASLYPDISQKKIFTFNNTEVPTTGIYVGFNINVDEYANLIGQGDYCYLGLTYRFANIVFSDGTSPAKVDIRLGFRNAGGGYYYTGGGTVTWSSIISVDGMRSRRLCGQTTDDETVTQFSGINFRFVDSNNNFIAKTVVSGTIELWNPIVSTSRETYDNTSYQVAWKSFDISKCFVYNNTLDEYVRTHSAFLVPLGKFRVKEIQNQASAGLMKKTLTMYDDLVDLEQNAFNWYTKYMYGLTTYTDDSPSSGGGTPSVRYGLEYTRQIFSTWYNFCNSGYNDLVRKYHFNEPTQLMTWTYDECLNHVVSQTSKYYWSKTYSTSYGLVCYAEYILTTNISSNNLYKCVANFTRTAIGGNDYSESGEPILNMKVLVNEFSGNIELKSYIVNFDDYFMISKDCTKLRFLIPIHIYWTNTDIRPLLTNVYIYYTPNPYPYLENGSEELYYYQYDGDHEIFKIDSTITGRDVIRSLLEVCGCLFRLDRYDGKPEFIYCTKSGLYPSETLYPADDLYPKVGHDASIYESSYISTQHEDYTIKNYGKIQILKNYTGNDTESTVQWTYTAPDTTNENTYVIDDNIFYSNAELVYEEDNMPQVARLLETMYEKICDMSYTPQITKAVGLPFVECGDRIGVITHFGGFETFVYSRTLTGIQALFDTYESRGDEYTSGVNDF